MTEPSASSMTAFGAPCSRCSARSAHPARPPDRHHPIRLTVALHELAVGERVVGHEVGGALGRSRRLTLEAELPATLGSGAPGVTSLRTWKEPNR